MKKIALLKAVSIEYPAGQWSCEFFNNEMGCRPDLLFVQWTQPEIYYLHPSCEFPSDALTRSYSKNGYFLQRHQTCLAKSIIQKLLNQLWVVIWGMDVPLALVVPLYYTYFEMIHININNLEKYIKREMNNTEKI